MNTVLTEVFLLDLREYRSLSSYQSNSRNSRNRLEADISLDDPVVTHTGISDTNGKSTFPLLLL